MVSQDYGVAGYGSRQRALCDSSVRQMVYKMKILTRMLMERHLNKKRGGRPEESYKRGRESAPMQINERFFQSMEKIGIDGYEKLFGRYRERAERVK